MAETIPKLRPKHYVIPDRLVRQIEGTQFEFCQRRCSEVSILTRGSEQGTVYLTLTGTCPDDKGTQQGVKLKRGLEMKKNPALPTPPKLTAFNDFLNFAVIKTCARPPPFICKVRKRYPLSW
ncbi:hypothetical protein J6590_023997 [Homalodisca vitripennis]|nr:hypothetical protein J6590_023997 [Homalodisca vitripennis]